MDKLIFEKEHISVTNDDDEDWTVTESCSKEDMVSTKSSETDFDAQDTNTLPECQDVDQIFALKVSTSQMRAGRIEHISKVRRVVPFLKFVRHVCL